MTAEEIRAVRTADDNENITASEIGVCAAGSILVLITVVLRYTGRLVLQRRMNEGRSKRGERIWGLDDGEYTTPEYNYTMRQTDVFAQSSTSSRFSRSSVLSLRFLSRSVGVWGRI